MIPGKMELPNEDIKFITDETLDFGLSSPSDGPEEEGSLPCPLAPSERCVAQAIDMNVLLGESEGRIREQASAWSSLSPEKLEEVMKEANMLAAQLERCKLQEKENATSELRLEKVPELEPLSAVRFLHAERASSRSPRRETFNVQNSPLKALLPTVGPESSSALQSPKTLSPKRGSPAPCVTDSPALKRTPNKSIPCSADIQLSKKSRPSHSPKTLTTTKSPSSKKTTNRKDRPAVIPHPGTVQDEESLLSVKPPLWESSRKVARASRQTSSAKDPRVLPVAQVKRERAAGGLSLQDSPGKHAVSVAQMRGNQGARLSRLQTIPVKKPSIAQERVVPLQKTKASQAKTMGGDGSQSSSKLHSNSCQIRTRSIATSVLTSQLPVANSVPKATSHIATLGRPAVPGRSSQLKPLSLGVPGAKRSTLPIPAGKKASVFQPTIPPCTSQNSRLQPLKKTTSISSRSSRPVIGQQRRKPVYLSDLSVWQRDCSPGADEGNKIGHLSNPLRRPGALDEPQLLPCEDEAGLLSGLLSEETLVTA